MKMKDHRPSGSASTRGIRAKIQRAERHLAELTDAFQAWGKGLGNPLTVREMEDLPTGKRVTGVLTTSPVPETFSLHLGDTLHNLRSALDHTICQLAIAAGNSGACDRTQFPVYCQDTSKTRERLERWIAPLSPNAKEEVRLLQPYRRSPSDPENDLLWMLSQLDNIDKHRLLLTADARLADSKLTVTIGDETKTYTLSNQSKFDPLKSNEIPFRLTVEGAPGTKVKVVADMITGIVFAQTGLRCNGREIFPVVRNMIADVTGILENFLTKGLLGENAS